MKHLILLRHAEAITAGLDLNDKDRPLSKHGLQQLDDIAKLLQQQELRCDQIISSSAKRALQTADGVAASVGSPTLVVDEKIYQSKADGLLGIVNNLDESLPNVLLVGHNPHLSALLNILSIDAKNYSLPTGGLAILRFDVSSWQIDLESLGEVIFLYAPH